MQELYFTETWRHLGRELKKDGWAFTWQQTSNFRFNISPPRNPPVLGSALVTYHPMPSCWPLSFLHAALLSPLSNHSGGRKKMQPVSLSLHLLISTTLLHHPSLTEHLPSSLALSPKQLI